jgi:hypothetical protein
MMQPVKIRTVPREPPGTRRVAGAFPVDRLGGRDHPQAETDPSAPTQRIGQTEVPQRLQQEEERLSPERIPECSEQEAREWGDAVLLREELPGRLEATSVSHAGRTDRLAAPAAEAGIEVLTGRRDHSLESRFRSSERMSTIRPRGLSASSPVTA